MTSIVKNVLLAGVASAALALTGCATIANGETQKMQVKSKPQLAQVKVDGSLAGKTPITLDLARKQDHTVEISLPGYQTTRFNLTRKISGWFYGNVLLGGIIGIAVDMSNGSMYALTPEELKEYASRTDIHYHARQGELMVILVPQTAAKWRKVGQLSQHA